MPEFEELDKLVEPESLWTAKKPIEAKVEEIPQIKAMNKKFLKVKLPNIIEEKAKIRIRK